MPSTSTNRVTELCGVSRAAILERDDEIRTLEAALVAAAAGRGATLRIEPASGLGKTVLLEVTRDLAVRRGFLVLEAVASAADRELPLAVVHKLFASLPAGGAEWNRVEGPLRAAASGDPRALLELLHALVLFSADRPVLVSVDDLDRGDEQSLRFFGHLAFRSHRQRVAVVATGAQRGPGVVLRRRPSSPDSHSIDRVHRARARRPRSCRLPPVTGGNPRFIHELVAEVAAVGLAPTAEHAWTLDALLRRLGWPRQSARAWSGSPPMPAALTEALAILGDGTPAGRVAALADLDIETVERTADELAAADSSRRDVRSRSRSRSLGRRSTVQAARWVPRTAHRKAVRVLGLAGASAAGAGRARPRRRARRRSGRRGGPAACRRGGAQGRCARSRSPSARAQPRRVPVVEDRAAAVVVLGARSCDSGAHGLRPVARGARPLAGSAAESAPDRRADRCAVAEWRPPGGARAGARKR